MSSIWARSKTYWAELLLLQWQSRARKIAAPKARCSALGYLRARRLTICSARLPESIERVATQECRSPALNYQRLTRSRGEAAEAAGGSPDDRRQRGCLRI